MKKKIKRTQKVNKKSFFKKINSSLVHLAHPNRKILRHFRLLKKHYSFKILHHKHTAHLPLFLVLFVFGLFLFINQSYVVAQEIEKTKSVTVSAIIPGPPPSLGAQILSPIDNFEASENQINISGTCEPQTVIVVYNNSLVSGSTFCSIEGIFSVTIQINIGQNAIQAKNFDIINQSGPETPTVIIVLKQKNNNDIVNSIAPVKPKPSPIEDLENPIIIPPVSSSKKTCKDYNGIIDKSIGGPLNVSIVCTVRGLQIGQQSQLGFIINGGQPPYAVDINLGHELSSEENILLSVPEPDYVVVPIKYEQAGQYDVKIKSKDKHGSTAFSQSVIEVYGVVGLTNFASIKDTIEKTSWLNTSIPAYLLVLVLTVGFWIGDAFNRYFGDDKRNVKHRLKVS